MEAVLWLLSRLFCVVGKGMVVAEERGRVVLGRELEKRRGREIQEDAKFKEATIET